MPPRSIPAIWPSTWGLPDDHDRALIQRIAAGDCQAFAQLYQVYAQRLAGYLRRRLWQLEQVDDVLHDVMLAIWQQAPTYQGTGRVSTWIFGIAKYKALQARASAARQSPARRAARPHTPEETPLDEGLIRQERTRTVAAALAVLRPEQRAVVELTYYHHWSYHEIAVFLDCPVNTIKTRMEKARRHLAAHLTRLGLPSL